jgi:hypothetical protein
MLYYLLSQEKVLVFIAGATPSFIKPSVKMDNFVVLEELDVYKETTPIGLTIEAIRYSKLVVGPQSAIPVLANLLKTPTLMWGHEQERHQKQQNHYNTPCTFLVDMEYTLHPTLVMSAIKKELNL